MPLSRHVHFAHRRYQGLSGGGYLAAIQAEEVCREFLGNVICASLREELLNSIVPSMAEFVARLGEGKRAIKAVLPQFAASISHALSKRARSVDANGMHQAVERLLSDVVAAEAAADAHPFLAATRAEMQRIVKQLESEHPRITKVHFGHVRGRSSVITAKALPAPAHGDLVVTYGDVIVAKAFFGEIEKFSNWIRRAGMSRKSEPLMRVFVLSLAERYLLAASDAYRGAAPQRHSEVLADAQPVRIYPCVLFMLIHELGHVLLGHTDLIRNQVETTRQERHEHEFEADAFALATLSRYESECGLIREQVRLMLEAHRIARWRSGDDEESDSHPSLGERIRRMGL